MLLSRAFGLRKIGMKDDCWRGTEITRIEGPGTVTSTKISIIR